MTEKLGQETYPAANVKNVCGWGAATESPDSIELISDEVLDALSRESYAPGDERSVVFRMAIKELADPVPALPSHRSHIDAENLLEPDPEEADNVFDDRGYNAHLGIEILDPFNRHLQNSIAPPFTF